MNTNALPSNEIAARRSASGLARQGPWPLGRIGLVLALALLPAGCSRPHQGRETAPALPVAIVRAQRIADQPLPLTEEIVGTVRARKRATLEAKVAGRIVELPVALGQTLKAGDPVARLDVREIQARLDQARAVLEQAQRDRARFQSLWQQQAVTRAEFDAVEARYRVAEAAVAEAETMFAYAEVRAPFDGVVSRKLAEVGDLASPGRPLIELDELQPLRLEADVPEALAGRVQPGATLPVRIANPPVELDGVVSEIAPAADPNSRTFRVKLDLPHAAGLKPGQFGRVAIPIGETHAARVPASALVQRGQMEIVFVVNEGRAHLRLVKSGRRFGAEVELVSGVRPGELVVIEGASGLTDGQPVQLR